MNVKNQLNWYNTYFSLEKDSPLAQKLERAAQAIWDLYAESANCKITDQESDDSEDEENYIYAVRINPETGKAERYNLYTKEFEPLFKGDVYDLLFVGIADEIIYCEGYELQ